jgi:phosphoserine phosphatase
MMGLKAQMRLAFTLVAPNHDTLQDAIPAAVEAIAQAGRPADGLEVLGEGAADIFVEGAELVDLRAAARRGLERAGVDFCVQPAEGRLKRLLVADMDSTVIGCECLDEIADYAGLKAEISAVTARAMAGEIPFEDALRARVRLLAGLEIGALQQAFDERVRLNPGAATLARTMTVLGARCVLVSGGFDFFTSRVAAAAGFSAHFANRLIDDGARLTGEVAEPILGREAKLAALTEEALALGLDLSETIAVGDGANDVAMIEAAGLGIAYRAKPILAEHADARVETGDLTALLYFQGVGQDAFA